jgi:hypothetical protein
MLLWMADPVLAALFLAILHVMKTAIDLILSMS